MRWRAVAASASSTSCWIRRSSAAPRGKRCCTASNSIRAGANVGPVSKILGSPSCLDWVPHPRLASPVGYTENTEGVGDDDVELRIGAELYKVDLSGASLIGADLSDVYLAEADLRQADLRGAGLQSTTSERNSETWSGNTSRTGSHSIPGWNRLLASLQDLDPNEAETCVCVSGDIGRPRPCAASPACPDGAPELPKTRTPRHATAAARRREWPARTHRH